MRLCPTPYAVHLLLHGNLDLPKAIMGLRALSHVLGTSDGSRALERGKIEKALNFPLENTDEALEEISRIRDKTMWKRTRRIGLIQNRRQSHMRGHMK